jgi:archaellum component FlaC
MDEKDFKRLLEESAAKTHRRIDAIAVETREQFAKMEERFDQIDVRDAQTQTRFDQIDARDSHTQTRFDQIDARFDQIDARFDQVDARFSQVDARFDQVDARFSKVDARFDRVDARFEQVDAHFEQVEGRFEQVDARADDLKTHIDETAKQIKQDFHIVAESMRADVQQVAEGVVMLNAKLDREAADIRREMREGFAETQSLLRFSHGQLDKRITTLERAAKR